MKRLIFLIGLCAALLLLLVPRALASERIDVTAADGAVLQGKLDSPEGAPDRLVLFVNGSGPNTYDNTRQLMDGTFNYYDLFAEQLTAGGAAFFRWSTRGCAPDDEPPLYTHVDGETYQTYVPDTSISDVESVIMALRADPRLADCPVWLLGWSEGTMIAPQVAARQSAPVDALVLCGYVNGTMAETLEWQQTGGASMVFYRQYFDTDGDGRVSSAEFEADPYGLRAALEGVRFADLDADGDGQLTEADFGLLLAGDWQTLRDAISRGDDGWLAENYPVRLTSAWFEGHAKLTPNREILPTLDLPIYILHGECDANAPVQGARDIEAAFEALHKDNLTVHIYPEHDHDLNVMQYVVSGELSEAFQDLFRILTE